MNNKIKVLMVDDEEQFRKTTKKILERRGFITIMAESGEEAIEKITKNPDVVILDINMPGIDGIQTLKKLKEISPELPVIMLTGFGTELSARNALNEDAVDYLNKPCDMDLLASKIISVYRHKKDKMSYQEMKVREIMIPIEDYTTLGPEATVKDAICKIKKSFISRKSTEKIMETGHRSLLVLDKDGHAKGILTIFDLLNSIMPSYLNAPKPSMADSIKYSPMFWKGMFYKETSSLADKKINEIMSPVPVSIDGDSCLMEAAYMLVNTHQRRLVVTNNEKITGVLREQDLFFEMERVLRN